MMASPDQQATLDRLYKTGIDVTLTSPQGGRHYSLRSLYVVYQDDMTGPLQVFTAPPGPEWVFRFPDLAGMSRPPSLVEAEVNDRLIEVRPHLGPGVLLPVLVHAPGIDTVWPPQVLDHPVPVAEELIFTGPIQIPTRWDAILWPDGSGGLAAHLEPGVSIGDRWQDRIEGEPSNWLGFFDKLADCTPYSDTWETFDLMDCDPVEFFETLTSRTRGP